VTTCVPDTPITPGSTTDGIEMTGGGGGGGGEGISSMIGGGSLMIVGTDIVSSEIEGTIEGGAGGIIFTGDGGDGSEGISNDGIDGGGGMNGGIILQILARCGRSTMWLTNLIS